MDQSPANRARINLGKKALVLVKEWGFDRRGSQHLFKFEGIVAYSGDPLLKVCPKPWRKFTLQINPDNVPPRFNRGAFGEAFNKTVDRPHPAEADVAWVFTLA